MAAVTDIRAVRQTEAPEVYGLFKAFPEEIPSCPSVPELEREIADPAGLYFGVWEGGVLAGCAGGRLLAVPEAEIRYLAVQREFWGRGLGRRLVEGYVQECFRRHGGPARLFIEVTETNRNGASFYERMGAQRIQFRKNYYGAIGAWVYRLG
jgi:ribosomal protein S18 acetylase RimI-like enzyme